MKEAFVKTVIDGFSSGSLRVFFKVLFDKKLLPRWVEATKVKGESRTGPRVLNA